MYRQLRGLYNAAALNGGMGIRSVMRRLRGGWARDAVWNADEGAVRLARDVENKYGLPAGTLDETMNNIHTYDTFLIYANPKGAKDFKDSLQMTPAQKKIWTYLRTKIHRGGTRRTITRAMKDEARNQRAQNLWALQQGNWYGSDPYVNGELARRYAGLSAYRPRKTDPGYVRYQSPFLMMAPRAGLVRARDEDLVQAEDQMRRSPGMQPPMAAAAAAADLNAAADALNAAADAID